MSNNTGRARVAFSFWTKVKKKKGAGDCAIYWELINSKFDQAPVFWGNLFKMRFTAPRPSGAMSSAWPPESLA
jgi:hypothetical protein